MGYVGLPLAAEFSKQRPVVGFDIDQKRIKDLKSGFDSTNELNSEELIALPELLLTSNKEDISSSNCFIISVPTPIDEQKRPNLKPLLEASKTVGKILKPGDIVIYESTVYPGCTEEDCVPVLEKYSNLIFNTDFFCGYSPERINPGDKDHTIASIKKVTSGSTPETADLVDSLYKEIIKAGTHKAPSIKVAEASKVIENVQRDLNIALINELSIIFQTMDIDTEDVLLAAGTKWNFIPFRPGLVGGHCIGVDPYYLTYKSELEGYKPQIILSGRNLNDNMALYVVEQLLGAMTSRDIDIETSRVLVMGLTFKENCPDIRNSKVIDVVKELEKKKIQVDIIDPWADHEETKLKHDIDIKKEALKGTYDAIILAVGHKEFIEKGPSAIRSFGKRKHILYDLKYLFSSADTDMRL